MRKGVWNVGRNVAKYEALGRGDVGFIKGWFAMVMKRDAVVQSLEITLK